MAAPTFKITFDDGTVSEVKLRPRAQIDFEEETGDTLVSLDSDEMRVSKLYKLAWFAAGKPDTFDEWIDSLDAVEMAGDEDADGEDTPAYLTDNLVRLALYTGQPLDQVTRSDLVASSFAWEYADYWPIQTELLAATVEHLSALLVAFLRANGAKNVGRPIKIPRPQRMVEVPEFEEGEPDTRVAAPPTRTGPNIVSFSEFQKMLRPPK